MHPSTKSLQKCLLNLAAYIYFYTALSVLVPEHGET